MKGYIDYPEDRELLKQEFAKICSMPGHKEAVEKIKKMLAGPPRRKPRNRLRKDEFIDGLGI